MDVPNGVVEVRAFYGIMEIFLGTFILTSTAEVSLRLAMYILLGCAIGRYLSVILIDGRDSKLDFTNQNLHLIIGFFEFAGALLNWHYLNKEREAIQKAR